jgi:hypothetical protein
MWNGIQGETARQASLLARLLAETAFIEPRPASRTAAESDKPISSTLSLTRVRDPLVKVLA